jgi:hypothetical protein
MGLEIPAFSAYLLWGGMGGRTCVTTHTNNENISSGDAFNIKNHRTVVIGSRMLTCV